MKPVFRLPGRTALAALMTFFSDNPAVISLAKDSRFRKGFTPLAAGVAHQLRHSLRHGADRGDLYGHLAAAER